MSSLAIDDRTIEMTKRETKKLEKVVKTIKESINRLKKINKRDKERVELISMTRYIDEHQMMQIINKIDYTLHIIIDISSDIENSKDKMSKGKETYYYVLPNRDRLYIELKNLLSLLEKLRNEMHNMNKYLGTLDKDIDVIKENIDVFEELIKEFEKEGKKEHIHIYSKTLLEWIKGYSKYLKEYLAEFRKTFLGKK